MLKIGRTELIRCRAIVDLSMQREHWFLPEKRPKTREEAIRDHGITFPPGLYNAFFTFSFQGGVLFRHLSIEAIGSMTQRLAPGGVLLVAKAFQFTGEPATWKTTEPYPRVVEVLQVATEQPEFQA